MDVYSSYWSAHFSQNRAGAAYCKTMVGGRITQPFQKPATAVCTKLRHEDKEAESELSSSATADVSAQSWSARAGATEASRRTTGGSHRHCAILSVEVHCEIAKIKRTPC